MVSVRRKLRVFVFLMLMTAFGGAKEFSAPEEVLAKLFPGSKVEIRNLILTEEQKLEVERRGRVKLDSRLVSFYLVKKDGKTIAYGYVDTHRVRTRSESVLFVINPSGEIELVEVLAFNEPLEYMADERWLSLFRGKALHRDQIRLKRDIPNITGSTLTARVITKAARKALALWSVLFGDKG
jgi:Na+-translocating ferredoxin:NAD+ oxidoreductase RnfG subunit